jgi:hypothetical protein
MSDVMLFGVLKMPYEMAMADELSRRQFYERVQELVARVESQDDPKPSAQGPEVLWLQLHGDCSDAELSEPVDYTSGDVTWCWHAINDSDIRYVRADLAQQAVLEVDHHLKEKRE